MWIMSLGLCGFCLEPVEPGEECPNMVGPEPLHRDCGIRLVIGPVAHLKKRCSCFIPDSEEADPPELTLRQAARAAVMLYNLQQREN